jgi:arsenite methyltransferase
MSNGLQFDEEISRKVESLYMTPDVVAQRRQVLKALALREGERVLDIGTGPGLLAYDMAASVSRNGRVCGIDISDDMLIMSRRRCADQPWTEFKRGDATNLPYPDASFDAAVSTQVYEYVVDTPAALAELYRVVRPGGRAVVMDNDYGSLVIHTEHEARMKRVLSAWDEHFVHAGLPRTLSRQLRDAGFIIRQRDAIPMFNPEYRENTFGKGALAIMATFAVGQGVSREEADAWLAEFAELSFSSASIVTSLLRTSPRLLAESNAFRDLRHGSVQNRRQIGAGWLVVEADGHQHLLFDEPQTVIEAPAEHVVVAGWQEESWAGKYGSTAD